MSLDLMAYARCKNKFHMEFLIYPGIFFLAACSLYFLAACTTPQHPKRTYNQLVIECIADRALPVELLQEGYDEAYWVGMDIVIEKCTDKIQGDKNGKKTYR